MLLCALQSSLILIYFFLPSCFVLLMLPDSAPVCCVLMIMSVYSPPPTPTPLLCLYLIWNFSFLPSLKFDLFNPFYSPLFILFVFSAPLPLLIAHLVFICSFLLSCIAPLPSVASLCTSLPIFYTLVCLSFLSFLWTFISFIPPLSQSICSSSLPTPSITILSWTEEAEGKPDFYLCFYLGLESKQQTLIPSSSQFPTSIMWFWMKIILDPDGCRTCGGNMCFDFTSHKTFHYTTQGTKLEPE